MAQVKRNSSAKENAPEPKTAQEFACLLISRFSTNVKENAVMATALLVLRFDVLAENSNEQKCGRPICRNGHKCQAPCHNSPCYPCSSKLPQLPPVILQKNLFTVAPAERKKSRFDSFII